MNAAAESPHAAPPLALITGGSAGLGLALAQRLCHQGYELILIARNEERLAQAAGELAREARAPVQAIAGDISDPQFLGNLASRIAESGKQIDLLILNAGIVRVSTLAEAELQDLKEVNDINYWGTVLSTKLLLPFLSHGSHILFISSAFALIGGAGYASYCGSKAGILNFAAALRRELRGRSAVHVACPGDLDTPFYAREQASLPGWMRQSRVRSRPMAASKAAMRILGTCRGDQFLIFTDLDLYLLLSVLPRFLPHRWLDWLGDQLLPTPP